MQNIISRCRVEVEALSARGGETTGGIFFVFFHFIRGDQVLFRKCHNKLI